VESAYHDVHGKVQAFVDKTTKVYKEHEELYKMAKETFDVTWRPTLPPHRAKMLEAKLKGEEGRLAIEMEGKQNAEADLRSLEEAMAALHKRPDLAKVWAALRAKESVFGRFTAALFGGSA
jgi:hypothetical protein